MANMTINPGTGEYMKFMVIVIFMVISTNLLSSDSANLQADRSIFKFKSLFLSGCSEANLGFLILGLT